MSLTNPKSVVTEERLSDFYQGILPYLGGMPEMVANKFSKGDLYSTEEKMIGQWYDGRPVYQKTWVVTTGIVATYNTWVNTPIPNPNIKTLINGTFRDLYTDGSYVQCSNVLNYMSFAINSNYIKLLSTRNTTGNIGAYIVTLKYTKSTDSAISIGDANDYSTEEKIVGTWIDGKPVYQKTVVMTMPTTTSKRDGAFWQGDASVDVTGLNISQLVNLTAMSSYPSICNLIPYFGYATEVEATQYAKMNAIMCWCNKSTISIRRYTPSSVNSDAGADVYVTIQYTKTTT